jgi:hypothetical protein
LAWEQQHNINTRIKRVVVKTQIHSIRAKSKKKIKFPKLLNRHNHNQITPLPSSNIREDTTTYKDTKEKLETARKKSQSNIISKIKKNVVAKWSKLRTFRWKGSPLTKQLPTETATARAGGSLSPALEISGDM